MLQPDLTGVAIPAVRLGYLQNGELFTVWANKFFAEGRTIVLGVPGAFTPVCSTQHIPDFIRSAEKFKAFGFRQLVCIAPNDPFALDAWARHVDPEGKIRFLSDGNLEFTRALGVASVNTDLFIGVRSQRYLMVVEDGTIVRLRIEPDILTYGCSTADEALSAAEALDIMLI